MNGVLGGALRNPLPFFLIISSPLAPLRSHSVSVSLDSARSFLFCTVAICDDCDGEVRFLTPGTVQCSLRQLPDLDRIETPTCSFLLPEGNSMGNSGSTGANGRRRHGSRRGHSPPPGTPTPQAGVTSNRYVVAAATTYPPQYPNPNPPPQYYQYPGYYPPPPPVMPVPLPAPYDHHHHRGGGGPPHVDQVNGNWVGGRYPCGPVVMMPYVEHQKAVTIRNDVNIKKETLRIEPDEENPGKFLVSFTFDATVDGRITVVFFAKEGVDCSLSPMKEDLLPPVILEFQEGLGQKFKQPSGTGIEFSMFEEKELRYSDTDVYTLAVKAEASVCPQKGPDGNVMSGTMNSQITQAVFEKEKGEYQVRVVKQILWVNGMRYELQEIYGIGNSVESDIDGNDPGKECVICLSEPRDTTVLPCRHMCMCSGCAKVLRFQTNRCPICRQPVERLLEIKVSSAPDESSCP